MNGYNQPIGGAGQAADEPGASDNRLSLNVHEFLDGEMEEWQDQTKYRLDGVIIEQVSPGEFTISSIESGKEAGPMAAEGEQEEKPDVATDRVTEEAEQGEKPSYANPAVAGMMSSSEE